MDAANNTTDRREGVVGEVGCKYPCKVATITNIVLEGEQTVNGVAVSAGTGSNDADIVLVNGQTDATENGIYVVSTGDWQRAVWFDNQQDATEGTLVFVTKGSLYPQSLWRTVCADDPIIFGTSEITFVIVTQGNNTGDVTLSGETYLTLVNQVITAHKILLANMANLAANSFLGNNTGSAATPIALTIAQATAALNAMVGDSGSGGTKGLVPAPAAGEAAALKYLKADGTWQTTPSAAAASETVAGVLELATQAETNTGTDDLRAVTPLKLTTWYGTKTSTSALKTITGAAALTIAHGLGAVPNFITTILVCQTAELGYSIGDQTIINPALDTNNLNKGQSIVIDATNLYIRFGNDASVFSLVNKTTGDTGGITAANWKIKYIAAIL